MPTIMNVNAIRNINSKILFILLEKTADNKMTIINPQGKVITVPEGLFESPFLVSQDKFIETFTQEQVQAIEKYATKSRSSARKSSGTVKKRRKKAEPLKFGIGAEWNASKLTFYKHKIDPLSDSQSFKITIEEVGIFTITKSDFCKLFNDVVISTSYWEEGSFTYSNLPDKAKKFIKAA